MNSLKPLTIAIDPALMGWEKEIKYVFRTLLRVAGFPVEYYAATTGERHYDIYYGRFHQEISAEVSIPASMHDFSAAPSMEPTMLYEDEGIKYLRFGGEERNGYDRPKSGWVLSGDIIFSSYWLLTGAREHTYPRNRVDDLDLGAAFLYQYEIISTPLVSIYGNLIRQHFQRLGYESLVKPWASSPGSAAFVFTHDVDYPQIVRWIETVRLLKNRGLKGTSSIVGIWNGSNHFWKFDDWMKFESEYGARSAFYFMAHKGSIFRYGLGRYGFGAPDSFYDIRRQEFRELFHQMADNGFEVGLHASFNAYRSLEQLEKEKRLLETTLGAPVVGNRHHYWHLDPDAPHETLRLNERAGLVYDSSLAFEFYPGFRRGICQPFRPYHPGERRELNLVELTPTWMDNHFDKRLSENHISDSEAFALRLVETTKALGGATIVDYHPRGLNSDFYPRFGPWLVNFVRSTLDSRTNYYTPAELVRIYLEYERRLADQSRDFC